MSLAFPSIHDSIVDGGESWSAAFEVSETNVDQTRARTKARMPTQTLTCFGPLAKLEIFIKDKS